MTIPSKALRTYINPVGGEIRMGDPFVKRYGARYYLTGTTQSGGFQYWTSPDLVNWTHGGKLFEFDDARWGERSFWAPELFSHRGKYYLAYSAAVGPRGQGPGFRMCLAVSATPEGPYRDLHAPWCDLEVPVIDAHVFFDTDQTPYLYFTEVGIRRGAQTKLLAVTYVVPLKEDLSGPAGEPVECVRADQPWEMPPQGRSHCNEGAFVFEHFGTYYLTYSANHYAEPFYGIGYATAPSPLGPWTKSPDNPLVSADLEKGVSGPGHNCFVLSPDGRERFMVYHAHANLEKPSGLRTVNIDRVTVDASGRLSLDGPTRTPQPYPSGARPE
ncbi:MAG: glycoside hydrolase family 43 protein [Opitutales bacterium]